MAYDSPNALDHVDVIIVGAGLSGVGAARHLQQKAPDKTFAILEARDAIGGTWDLFRYPGVRSDSDMFTLGYTFKPWTEAKAIADGDAILRYVREAAAETGIDQHIRFQHRVVRAAWSSADARWTVECERGPEKEIVRITCGFLFMCSGYYRTAAGYMPDYPGIENFKGRVIHPQNWPQDLDVAGKRIVVIGSGATAVTLVPELAQRASHVTMLQRSPTYIVGRPGVDPIAEWLRKRLPQKLAYALIRWKNVLLGMYFFRLCRRDPERVKALIRNNVRAHLGEDFDVETHFTPRYNPWDQRLCLAPDGDFFAALKSGRASVATDHIERFTEDGILLKSGAALPADIVVSATGLVLEVLGGMQVSVDGRAIDFSKTFNYKGIMYSDVPNLASSFGYTNASWTLKCDLTCDYVTRLINHMSANGLASATPRVRDADLKPEPWLDFSSGYVQRAMDYFPKQGNKKPWKLYQNYVLDLMTLRHGKLDDGVLEFARRPAPAAAASAAAERAPVE